MIKIEKVESFGWEAAIRGMRNPKNSWDKMDSDKFEVGHKDLQLMMDLAHGGPVHAKYRRMIVVYADITAPLYWWKEFDTYKVGTVSNSCSTMHKLTHKVFTRDDFSHDKLLSNERVTISGFTSFELLDLTISMLNQYRTLYLMTKDKRYWWQMIQLLPSSYNQKRTVMLNYEVLVGMYNDRKNHKLDEWHILCEWIHQLPYSEIITLE